MGEEYRTKYRSTTVVQILRRRLTSTWTNYRPTMGNPPSTQVKTVVFA